MAHGTFGMLDAIVIFQGGADLEPTHRPPSFLNFSRLEHAQTAHEHTEQPTTQLRSVSFVDATNAIQWGLKKTEKLKQLATKERFLLVFWVDGDPYKVYGAHLARH